MDPLCDGSLSVRTALGCLLAPLLAGEGLEISVFVVVEISVRWGGVHPGDDHSWRWWCGGRKTVIIFFVVGRVFCMLLLAAGDVNKVPIPNTWFVTIDIDDFANIYNGRRCYLSLRCLGPLIVGVVVDTDFVLLTGSSELGNWCCELCWRSLIGSCVSWETGVAGTTSQGQIGDDSGFRRSDCQWLLKGLSGRPISAKGFVEEAHSPASVRLSRLQYFYCYSWLYLSR